MRTVTASIGVFVAVGQDEEGIMHADRSRDTTRRWKFGSGVWCAAIAGVLLLEGLNLPAEAALTAPSCLARKLREWGRLRKCQGEQNGRALQGKLADLANCQERLDYRLGKISSQAATAGVECRYGINTGPEAGTVTDYDTGLTWERKTDDGTVHDKDNPYTWNTMPGGTTPSGTMFTEFLGTLNNGMSSDGATTSGCFAGHCDWRVPKLEELVGILDCSFPSPCIDQAAFGPTANFVYLSATTPPSFPGFVWAVDFVTGGVGLADKSLPFFHARAVRSAL